jgi:pyridoxal phosphate enzyme (YggS family)
MNENLSTEIQTRVQQVRDEIAAACARAGRNSEDVTLVAVSKTHPAAAVVQAIEAGVQHFGENRVEEATGKLAAVAALTDTPVAWHMIGHVQSRKARYVTSGFTLLHSLDSFPLAERLNRLLVEQGAALDVLLEVNVSGEESKQGWDIPNWQDNPAQRQALWQDVAQLLTLPAVNVRGLMTMAPIVEQPEAARPVFRALRGLRDALANDFPGPAWAELSMGMTDDYSVAVEEGATLVRVGRAIFGARA